MTDEPPTFNGQFDKAMTHLVIGSICVGIGTALGSLVGRSDAILLFLIFAFAAPFTAAILTITYYWGRPTARKDWFDKHPNY